MVAIGVGAYLSHRPAPKTSEPIVPVAPIKPHSVDPESSRTTAAGSVERSEQSRPVAGWRIPPAVVEGEGADFPISIAMHRDRKSQEVFLETRIEIITEGNPSMFSEIRRAAEAGDVEAAYRHAMVLMYCHGAPQNLSEAEAWVDQMPLAAEAAQEDDHIRAIIGRADVCSDLQPKKDRNVEAFRWFVAAADGGHMATMMQFKESGVQMLHPTWIKYPETFDIYRERSRTYLSRLVRTGHPEAFYRMAEAIYEEALFEYDGPTALAYAVVAESEGYRNSSGWELRRILEGRLSLPEQRQAARLARDLCERYCVQSARD